MNQCSFTWKNGMHMCVYVYIKRLKYMMMLEHHTWMMPTHSRDPAHDLSVKHSQCLQSALVVKCCRYATLLLHWSQWHLFTQIICCIRNAMIVCARYTVCIVWKCHIHVADPVHKALSLFLAVKTCNQESEIIYYFSYCSVHKAFTHPQLTYLYLWCVNQKKTGYCVCACVGERIHYGTSYRTHSNLRPLRF